ncbi:hypothetical protein [Yinghuangia seranimata]|uniref:hypothetical protein n=1 Tax=Yinghuangia seranimata TaxID=408067 RepID=UPI00248BF6D5|nr:hypothetical protein [Yinghuangia seranimata]MDI2129142.1 hypothetical protein [Yinghuangia seranimata]
MPSTTPPPPRPSKPPTPYTPPTQLWWARPVPDIPLDRGERRDPTADFAVVLACVVGFLSSGYPVGLLFFSMLPPDSCEPGSCGGGVRPETVVLALGFLAEIGLVLAAGQLWRRRQRVARWACALVAPAMPWLALGVVTGKV